MNNFTSLQSAAVTILETGDGHTKVSLTQTVVALWREGHLKAIDENERRAPPDIPLRPEGQKVIAPGDMPKLGKGGTLHSRIAILHSLANIELWAIDLAWDMIARFGHDRLGNGEALPDEFFDDFVRIAEDEARHFTMLDKRLGELGAKFGDLPVHNGLWQSASETAGGALARLAVVHMVHEARGLDVTPVTISRFEKAGDGESVTMLTQILAEEVTHVSAGMRWFREICAADNSSEKTIDRFHQLVRQHFHGSLKPPFNEQLRTEAGFTPDWYEPLVHV